MTNSIRPTPFQEQLLGRIDALVHRLDMVFDVAQRQGASELFFEGVIQPANIKIWLYDNEAEFRSGDLQRLCEAPDFASEAELAAYFMDSLEAELSKRQASGGTGL